MKKILIVLTLVLLASCSCDKGGPQLIDSKYNGAIVIEKQKVWNEITVSQNGVVTELEVYQLDFDKYELGDEINTFEPY